MKTMKSAFHVTLILYICTFLTGVPFVPSAFAKITPKNVDGETQLITIKRGDTLWHLASVYLKDPFLWREFKKYNDFTDPNLIYAGENVQLPATFVMPAGTSRAALEIVADHAFVTAADIEALKTELKTAGVELTETSDTMKNVGNQIDELRSQNQMLQAGLKSLSTDVQNATESNAEAIERLNESLMSQSESSKSEISKVNRQIETSQQELGQIETSQQELGRKIGALQKQQSDDFEAIKADTKSLSGEIGRSKKGINELQGDISKLQEDVSKLKTEAGEWEESSDQKRTLAILAAAAGGIAWFTINAIGHQD